MNTSKTKHLKHALVMSLVAISAISLSACNKSQEPQHEMEGTAGIIEDKATPEINNGTETNNINTKNTDTPSTTADGDSQGETASNDSTQTETSTENTDSTKETEADGVTYPDASTTDGSAVEAVTDESPTTNTDVDAKAEIDYICQDGKEVSVSYTFDSDGLPTYATIEIGSEYHNLMLNKDRSDEVDTIFGNKSTYTLATYDMTADNVADKAILITNSNQEIEFKNCETNNG